MTIEKLYEMLLCNKPSGPLLYNKKELFELIPELKECDGFDQLNPEWHPYDVFTHTLHVIDYTPCDLVLRLAALFHDVGKPKTLRLDDKGVGHFKGHWVVSQYVFDLFAKKHNLDPELASMVSKLIYYHDLRVESANKETISDMCEILGKDGIKLLYLLKNADLLAHSSSKHYLVADYNIQRDDLLMNYFDDERSK